MASITTNKAGRPAGEGVTHIPLPRQPTSDHPLSSNQYMPGEFSFPFPPQSHGRYQTINDPIPQLPMLPKLLSTEPEPTLPSPTIASSTQIPLPKPMSAENIYPQPSNALVISRPMIHPNRWRQNRDSPRRRSRSPDAPAERSVVTRQDLPAEIIVREKTRVVAQADLVTRQAIEEKDKTIGALNAQVQQYESQMAEFTTRMERMEELLHEKSGELEKVCDELREERQQAREETGNVEQRSRTGDWDMEATTTAVTEAVEGEPIMQDTERRPEEGRDDVDMEEGVRRGVVGETKKTTQKVRWIDVSDDEGMYKIEENEPEKEVSGKVPAPYRFSRPLGGGGPRLKATWASDTRPQPHADGNQHPRTPTSQIPHKDDQPSRSQGQQANATDDVPYLNVLKEVVSQAVASALQQQGAGNPILPSNPYKPRISKVVKVPIQRTKNPLKIEYGPKVRKEMYGLIGIRQAKQIVGANRPLRSIVDKCEDGTGPTPPLDPMRFSFEVSFEHKWNQEIQEKFVSTFVREYDVLDEDVLVIYDLVKQVYVNLRRYVLEANARDDEDEVQAKKRVKDTADMRLMSSRRATRKRTLTRFRIDVTHENRNNGADRAWDFLYQLAIMLGSDGMSSDESGDGNRRYFVKILSWRSAKLTPYLQKIDRDINRTNALGNSPGNPPRQRIRIAGGQMSKRKAVPGLPLNFYDKTWYAGLSAVDRLALNARPEMALPILEDI